MSKKSTILNASKTEKSEQQVNVRNEKVKHKYCTFLEEHLGYAEATVDAIKKAIYKYEEFSQYEDFSRFNNKRAISFKKWLENKTISLTTCYHYLRHVKDFFRWLSTQAGYKSRICASDVDYLRLDKQKSRIATSVKREDFPTVEQVKTVCHSIQIHNELDLRDRALIAFTLLSGMRDKAITTLPIGCFDIETHAIDQHPIKGVKTKFSKTFTSYLFKFDNNLLKYFLDWYVYLREKKLFGNTNPIFPKNKIENAEGTKTFISYQVEPAFWQSVTSMREIFKARFKEASLKYYPPHTFRHLAVHLAIKKCKNAEDVKAVSQNFGHEDVGTTMLTYGTLNHNRIGEIVTGMDFTVSDNDSELAAKIKALLAEQQGGNF